MAVDGNLLQGEIVENPETEQKDVERLLLAFLKALVAEQEGASR